MTSHIKNPAPHCRTFHPIVFNYGTGSQITLREGSIVEWTPEDGDLIRIHFAGTSKVISMDDAAPVEWNEADQEWVEEPLMGQRDVPVAWITIDTYNQDTGVWEVIDREAITDQSVTVDDLDAREAAELEGATTGTLTRVTLRDGDDTIVAATDPYEMPDMTG